MSNDVMREHKLREIIAALILEAEETGITQVTRKVAIDAISTPYRIPSSAPAQSEAKVLCETCGGSKVDPGGEGYCRSCKQQRVEPAVVKASGGNAHAKMLMDLQVLEDGTPLYTAPPSEANPVVKWERRMRPTWDKNYPWLEWEECSQDAAMELETNSQIHDWEYEVRGLSVVSATPAQSVTSRDDIERAIAFHHLEMLANGPVVAMQKTLSEFSAAPAQPLVMSNVQDDIASLRSMATVAPGYEAEILIRAADALAARHAPTGADAALEEAAKHLDKKADSYVQEFGSVEPDTGSLEFGRGPHADEKHEYYSTLLELAEEIRALKSKKEA
ncbi:hypothetical protein WM40_24980 [Robbsia andropogonis]|uniref:Uncharacterized protein n=2 Tax=Robbsia andropogonis TaxID=28092 RepID=A0A0F5JTJ1_9BURK|nr:hypothetical protein [Robbsia andropogonis]KKB61128.1 hypothetical protein WM40_24980 [Robbsia andropogonis]